jgi:tripartite-type tricarboxylate transporter receptor subunit TctC
MMKRLLLAAAAALTTLAPAFAQTPPPMTTLWSGFPTGGLGDQVTRPLLDSLRSRYPATLVYDAKPGAGGRIATDFVKRAPADGSVLLQVPSSPMALYPHTYGKKLNYDPLVDFAPVAPLAAYTMSMTVGPAVPADVKTVADFVKWAKANPEKANYGIPAPGSAPHFVGMMFERAAGLKMASVPYRGGGPLLQDLLGGQVPVAFNVVSEVLPYLKTGKLRALAVASPQRWGSMPEVPTFVELGYKDITVVEYLGWYAPVKTPREFVQRLNAAVQDAMGSPEMQAVMAQLGLVALRESPEVFSARIRQDLAHWAPIVKASGFTPED